MHYREKLGYKDTELCELYAFVAYACSFPNRFVALVDSYSTLNSGVKNFIATYSALYELGYKGQDKTKSLYGVRLDSGDLAQLSKDSKILFKQAGDALSYDFSHIIVFASNDINENVLKNLKNSDH